MEPAGEREEILFREARQRASGPERAAFLDHACARDPELRGRLEALLQAHESPDPFLEPPVAPASAAAVLRPEEGPGTVIGRYKLLQQIGEGGCGVVYMAEQEAPMRRRVALKIIKLGMDTKQVVARFEAERQALAMMDHPNIAQVLDGGATETGRPYFVLELVRGVRITDYCDQNNLPTVERLKLFVQVCHAIQHAHQKGVIHRDIKPSNILVSLHDDVPVAKVIDFGIAKAMGERLTDKTVFTRFEQFIGTPAYMSPEQAGVSGLDIDTRSDVYALGVLLYELLTGRTPFDPKQLAQAALEEILRRIREEEPPKPSTRLSTLAQEELTTAAQRRQTEPPRLISLVRGDLDWIVMKCLEKNRTRRYETANALAQDIEHHLNQEPVTAAAPSTVYRAGKFVHRHKAGLATATALVLLLVAGVLVSTWQAVRATSARRMAEDSRRAAVAEAAKATTIRDLLERALQSANPDAVKGSDYTVRQLLDDFSASLGDQLKGQPEVEAEIWATIGNTYRRLEATEKAQLHLERALALRRRLFGDQHPKFAESLVDLAYNQFMRARYAEGEALTRQALAVLRQQDLKRERVRALAMLQLCVWLQSRLLEAEQISREALSLAQEIRGPKIPEAADILHRLSGIKRDLGDLVEAERLGREAVALHRQLHGDKHPETGYALRDLGWTLEAQGKYAEAAPCYAELRTILQKQYGSTHPVAADAAILLARALVSAGRAAEAELLFREVDRAGNARTLNSLAWRLATRPESTFGDGTNAVELAAKAVALTTRTNAIYLDTLAAAYAAADQYTNAVKVQHEAVALLQIEELKEDYGFRLTLYESGSPYREHDALGQQTGILLAAGKYAEAEPLARECLALRERLAPDDWRTFNARSLLGGALLGQKKYAEAEPLLVVGYKGMKQREDKIPPAAKPRLRETLQRVVQLYDETGRPDQTAEWKKKLAEFEQTEIGKEPARPPR